MKKYIFALSLLLVLNIFFTISCKQEIKKEELKTEISKNSSETKTPAPLSQLEREQIKERGKTITSSTFKALSGNLQDAMKKGGVKQAVKYCKIAAMPLTDSLELAHNVKIKRTSLKVRNPENAPTQDEQALLERYQLSLENNLEINPTILTDNETSYKYFQPIYVKKLCLKCHGEPGASTKQKDYAIIKDLYPDDTAIGYKEGDLRGIWSVVIER